MAATTSNPGFVLILNDVILDRTLSAEAKATFGVLTHFDRGRGCFCKKETLAVFTKLSLFRLRKALRELEKSGRITIQPRKMGMTDLIRIVNRVPNRSVEGPIINEPLIGPPELDIEEPTIEPPELVIEEPQVEPSEATVEEPTIELPEIEDPPIEPSQLVIEDSRIESPPLDIEDPPIEPQILENEEVAPPVESVESQVETPVTPAGNDCHSKENKTKNTSTYTPPSYTGSLEATPQGEDIIKEIINHFFQLKEQRPAAVTETKHWFPVASQLLQDFTVEEIKGAIDHAVNVQNARLFYFIGLSAPSYIHSQRKKKEQDIEKPSAQDSQEKNEEKRRQIHREERRQNSSYKAETKTLLDIVSQQVRSQSYNVWFRDLFIREIKEDSIVLDVCSQTSADFIEQKYGPFLQEIAGKQVKFVS